MFTSKSIKQTVLAAALLGGLGLPVAQASHQSQSTACVFDKFAPTAVVPYKTENSIDWGSFSFTSGAQLFVPAREGLTKEWLTASVQRALVQAHVVTDKKADASHCDSPSVEDVHVNVVSGGNGYWVQLIGQDAKTAEKLMTWARALVAKQSNVAPLAAR
jgi:hypothetical protein